MTPYACAAVVLQRRWQCVPIFVVCLEKILPTALKQSMVHYALIFVCTYISLLSTWSILKVISMILLWREYPWQRANSGREIGLGICPSNAASLQVAPSSLSGKTSLILKTLWRNTRMYSSTTVLIVRNPLIQINEFYILISKTICTVI